MNIVYIVNTRLPNQKAHGFQIGKTCEKLAGLGNKVELWYPDRRNNIEEDIFDYYGLERNFKARPISCLDTIPSNRYLGFLAFYIQAILFSVRLPFKELDRDSIIYTRDMFIVLLLKMKGFRVVYNIHNWSNKRGLLARVFLNKNLKIICNSKGTMERVRKDGFINSMFVHNGVDLSDYQKKSDIQSMRNEIGLPLDKKIVMYVGHFYTWKGIDTVIESAKLLSRRSDVLFVLVGGSEDDIKKYALETEGLKNILLVGHRPKKYMPLYLQSADIVLLPNVATTDESAYYTSPLKMFEYMASGVPVIASDMASIREVLNQENSLLVPPSDAQAIAGGIERILGDNSLGQRLASCAYDDVKKYTWDEYARNVLDFIKK